MATANEKAVQAQEASASVLPRVTIKFCTQCQWMLRAAYYAQELLSTFSTSLGEVALIPATGGVFTVDIIHSPLSFSAQSSTDDPEPEDALFKTQKTRLWDRKTEGGFPETKHLKKLVRDIIDPSRDLGHVDRQHATQAAPSTNPNASLPQPTDGGYNRSTSPSTTQRAETMVADILSALPPSLTKKGGQDERKELKSPAEVSASETAEKMVANIMSSFRGEAADTDEAANIGGGSGGMGIDDGIGKEREQR